MGKLFFKKICNNPEIKSSMRTLDKIQCSMEPLKFIDCCTFIFAGSWANERHAVLRHSILDALAGEQKKKRYCWLRTFALPSRTGDHHYSVDILSVEMAPLTVGSVWKPKPPGTSTWQQWENKKIYLQNIGNVERMQNLFARGRPRNRVKM